MLTGSVLHIGATFFTIWNTNRIYYYHTVHFLRRINEYCSLNVFFIYITDTEQKQIQPCCNSILANIQYEKSYGDTVGLL